MRLSKIRLYTILTLLAISVFTFTLTAFPANKIVNVQYSQLTKDAQRQVDCLAQNIYFEAGYEPEQGQVAVALVTLNRVKDGRFANDICSVVKQKVKSTCQFTWFCEPRRNVRQEVYDRSKEIALYVYANYEVIKDFTSGALYYHADYVNPRWKLTKTTVVGRHIFYKEREGI